MSVSSLLNRYRIPALLFSISLMAVLIWHGNQVFDPRVAPLDQSANGNSVELLTANFPRSLTQNVRKTVLDNGLTVLTKEVHRSPVVTVQVWYKLGSSHEEAGVNGIAHQLEHVMFRGTKKRPIQFGRLFTALGGEWNAFTGYDHTAYYETVERNKLSALLELEADRMQNARIDAADLETEKRVVISELQGYENNADYRLGSTILQKVFPNHVYGLPVGGTKADVAKFNIEQLRKYYRHFYRPDNAVLVIVGDFNQEKAMKVVQKTFGKIPKPSTPMLEKNIPQTLDSYQASPSPVVVRESGSTALAQAVYPIPDLNHPDIPALDVMNYILSEGQNSRLEKALVTSGLATEIKTYLSKLSAGGWYEILVKTSPSQDLSKIDSVLKTAIATLAEKPITPAEVQRARVKLTASLILNNRDITSQGIQLGSDETTTGDYRYTDKYLAGISSVTMADVQRVAKKYLHPEVRTIGFFQPTSTYQQAKAAIQPHHTSVANLSINHQSTPSKGIDVTELSKYLPPVDPSLASHQQTLPQGFSLPNGLQILLLPDSNTPTITLSGYIKAGREFDPEDKAGLAALVATNLMSGTQGKDSLAIANSLAIKGANLDFETYREGVQIQGSSLRDDVPVLIKTLADVIQNPTFPKKELSISRQKALSKLVQNAEDPAEVAIKTFVQSVYPKHHPLHNFPSSTSLKNISPEDARAFNAKHYRPESTTLVIAGDFQPEKVRSLIASEFGNWQVNTSPPKLNYPAVNIPEQIVQLNPVVSGKAQAITYMGNTGIKRRDKRFYPALVLNQILGGDTVSSRLGAEIRDRQGLTYGIYSSVHAGKNFGTFAIEMQTAPENARKAIASTRKLLDEIHRRGVTSKEIEVAKSTLISNYNVSLANPEELTNKILMNQVYGFQPEELRNFTNKIQAVNLKQVNQAARELLHPDKIIVVTAGPAIVADSSMGEEVSNK
ncbi:MAG: pitrilysin family protein [Calothrix sp. MO_167.B12]|nr:pitrilysin family protein [Calothrix sp. MO_167.B12]